MRADDAGEGTKLLFALSPHLSPYREQSFLIAESANCRLSEFSRLSKNSFPERDVFSLIGVV